MKRSNANLITLNVVFVVCLIVANVVTSKVLDTGIHIGGVPVLIPGAALTYALTFLCTDVIGEIWGKKEANKAVIRGVCRPAYRPRPDYPDDVSPRL